MEKNDKTFLGTGWSFPPSFTDNGRTIVMSSEEKNIEESLNIILTTSLGERFLQPKFGCNLDKFLFRELDQEMITEIKDEIRDSITFHETRVDLEYIKVLLDDKTSGLIKLEILYRIRITNSRYNLVFPFYHTEASRVV